MAGCGALTTLFALAAAGALAGETGTGKSYLAEHFIHPRSGTKGPAHHH